MQLRPNSSARDAHAQLVVRLCEALSTFVAATSETVGPVETPSLANDNRSLDPFAYDDVMSLRDILFELGLKQSQVVKLRNGWGFPAPVGRARPMMFRRSEVERWAQSQPNKDNLAIVLRCRTRHF